MNKKILTVSLVLILNTNNFIRSIEPESLKITKQTNPLILKKYQKLCVNNSLITNNSDSYNNKNEIQTTLLQIINIICNPEKATNLTIILNPKLIKKIVENDDKENADLYELIIQEYKKRKNNKKKLNSNEDLLKLSEKEILEELEDLQTLSEEEILEELNNTKNN